MTTSEPPEQPLCVCDTTPLRHFLLAGHIELLAELLGGSIRVPRHVFDPEEDSDGIAALLSEIGQSERYWAARSAAPDRTEKWARLRALRTRADIEVIDLSDGELMTFAELQTIEYANSLSFGARLGPGEAAVIAIAESRDWEAVIDDAEGRAAFAQRVPFGSVITSRDLLRRGVATSILASAEADLVFADLLEGGYRGPESLWD